MCSLLGIGVIGVNVRIQVLIGHVLRLRLVCTLPDQLCQLDAVGRQGEALHVHQTVDAGAGLIGTQDYSAADDDTGQDGVHRGYRGYRVHRVYRVHRLHGVHDFVHSFDRHVAFGHFKDRLGLVLLIGEGQKVTQVILYNAVHLHEPDCELLSLGGWVCGQGDRGAFVDLVIGVNLSVNAPDLDRCRGILGGQGVAGCPLGQVIIALCLVIRHAVALVLAHKVQLVCIAFDRELTAFFRVGNLDGGFGGKGIADGDLLAGIEVNIAPVILKRGALQLCGGAAVRTEINAV